MKYLLALTLATYGLSAVVIACAVAYVWWKGPPPQATAGHNT